MLQELGRRAVIRQLTAALSVSFQAFYQRRREDENSELRYQEEIVISLVVAIRRRQPRIGTRKLLYRLRPDLKRLDFRLGRDALFSLLRSEGMLVSARKRRPYTTLSNHNLTVYPNLIEELNVRRVGQVLVSDITYLRLPESFCYLFLITDIASRMIVGWCLSPSLETTGALNALRTAARTVALGGNSIHHSDRGVQYCSSSYVSALKKRKTRISMGRVGSPQDNAVAERVNGILKGEFLLDQTFHSFQVAHFSTAQAISIYNFERPHLSLHMRTPAEQFQKITNRSPTYRPLLPTTIHSPTERV